MGYLFIPSLSALLYDSLYNPFDWISRGPRAVPHLLHQYPVLQFVINILNVVFTVNTLFTCSHSFLSILYIPVTLGIEISGVFVQGPCAAGNSNPDSLHASATPDSFAHLYDKCSTRIHEISIF